MSNYNKILYEFTKVNYNQSSLLQQLQIDKALDTISYQNAKIDQFDRQVAEELWQHTPKDSSNRVVLKDYIHSIEQAHRILKDQINSLQNDLRMLTNQKQKNQKLNDLYSYSQDYKILTAPFNIEQLRESAAFQSMRASQKVQHRENSSGIFSKFINDNGSPNYDLKIMLIITLIILGFQLLLMFEKHHFLSLISILGVLSIFFMGYFDKNYVKFVMGSLILTIIMEIVWIFVMASHYWNTDGQTQHTRLQSGFLKLIIFIIVLLAIAKAIVICFLIRYRNNQQDGGKVVEFLGLKFTLTCRPYNNPLSNIIGSR